MTQIPRRTCLFGYEQKDVIASGFNSHSLIAAYMRR